MGYILGTIHPFVAPLGMVFDWIYNVWFFVTQHQGFCNCICDKDVYAQITDMYFISTFSTVFLATHIIFITKAILLAGVRFTSAIIAGKLDAARMIFMPNWFRPPLVANDFSSRTCNPHPKGSNPAAFIQNVGRRERRKHTDIEM